MIEAGGRQLMAVVPPNVSRQHEQDCNDHSIDHSDHLFHSRSCSTATNPPLHLMQHFSSPVPLGPARTRYRPILARQVAISIISKDGRN